MTAWFDSRSWGGKRTMQYLLMCCIDERRWEALPEGERSNVMKDYGDFLQEIAARGQLRSSAKLRPSRTAATVRARNGKPLVTDGPFAETQEQLGGYHVVECKDLDEAISVAQRIPSLRVGASVEVRPVEEQHGAGGRPEGGAGNRCQGRRESRPDARNAAARSARPGAPLDSVRAGEAPPLGLGQPAIDVGAELGRQAVQGLERGVDGRAIGDGR